MLGSHLVLLVPGEPGYVHLPGQLPQYTGLVVVGRQLKELSQQLGVRAPPVPWTNIKGNIRNILIA